MHGLAPVALKSTIECDESVDPMPTTTDRCVFLVRLIKGNYSSMLDIRVEDTRRPNPTATGRWIKQTDFTLTNHNRATLSGRLGMQSFELKGASGARLGEVDKNLFVKFPDGEGESLY
jgi:hypothetical protein